MVDRRLRGLSTTNLGSIRNDADPECRPRVRVASCDQTTEGMKKNDTRGLEDSDRLPESTSQRQVDAEEQRVWVAGRRNGGSQDAYHTDKGCRQLQQSPSVLPRPLSQVVDDLELCDYCSGEFTPQGPDEPLAGRNLLLETNADEIPSPTEEI